MKQKKKARVRHDEEEEERQGEDQGPDAKKGKKMETSAMAFLFGATIVQKRMRTTPNLN